MFKVLYDYSSTEDEQIGDREFLEELVKGFLENMRQLSDDEVLEDLQGILVYHAATMDLDANINLIPLDTVH